jgi:hypothetical protein
MIHDASWKLIRYWFQRAYISMNSKSYLDGAQAISDWMCGD